MYPPYQLPKNHHVRAEVICAKHARGIRPEQQIHAELRQTIAAVVVDEKLTTTDSDYTTTYRLDLYVFSPDEFMRIVQEEALKYSFYSR